MMEITDYNLAMFMDKNFTKPSKFSLTRQEYEAIIIEIDAVLNELSLYKTHQVGLTDIAFRYVAIIVSDFWKKQSSKTNYLAFNKSFEVSIPIDICLFTIDFLSIEDKIYPADIRIPRGKMDAIISKNSFSAKFSTANIENLEVHKAQNREVRETQSIGLILGSVI